MAAKLLDFTRGSLGLQKRVIDLSRQRLRIQVSHGGFLSGAEADVKERRIHYGVRGLPIWEERRFKTQLLWRG